MNVRVINFVAPVVGVGSDFNTFRVGSFYAKRLLPGETVFLLNEKERIVFGKAKVVSVEVGPLGEMCLIHAHKNHTELDNEPATAPERLNDTLRKIYGPHIAKLTSKTTVVYLKRINDGDERDGGDALR